MIKVNKNYLKIFLVLIINLIIIYRIQIQTNFNLILGDVSAYDNTIQATILEHWYNVFKLKSEWLNVGYFYPYERTIAQSDAYFLVSFFYIPFRIFNLDPYLASELAGMLLKIIGFLGTFYLCRKVFNFNVNYTLVLCSLFTLNNAITYHGLRLQLATVAFVPWVLAIQIEAVKNYFKNYQKKATLQLSISAVFFGLWCFTCFYIAWFYFYFILITVIIIIIIYRKNIFLIFSLVKKNTKYLLIVVLSFILSLIPFIYTFYPKSLETGTRIYKKMKFTTMTIENFFQLGNSNKFYSPIYSFVLKYLSPNYVQDTWEYYNMGINFLIFLFMIFCLFYLLRLKTKSLNESIIIALIFATLIGMISISRVYDKSPWFFVYSLIPGAKALNVVPTFMYILCLPMYISAIYFIQKLKIFNLFKYFIILILLLAEYNDPFIRFYRPEQVQKNVVATQPPSKCKVFYVSGWIEQEKFYNYWEWINNQYAHNVSAMLISQLVNVPTINGMASFIPKDYDLVGPNGTAFSPNSPEYENRVANYITKYNLKNVCKLDLNSKNWTQIN